MSEQIRRVAVWSGWLRLSHWSMAGSVLLLLGTGWLIANAPSLAQAAADVHYLAAAVMVFALALRFFLGFFGKGSERFEHLVPAESEFSGMRESLVFYLSMGKAPMPNWFAQNPLWKPIYLVLFTLLALSATTGWLMPDRPVLWSLYLPGMHEGLATWIAIVTLLHILSVVLQDYRGRAADISAMINGERYFSIDREGLVKPEVPQVSIRLDQIKKD